MKTIIIDSEIDNTTTLVYIKSLNHNIPDKVNISIHSIYLITTNVYSDPYFYIGINTSGSISNPSGINLSNTNTPLMFIPTHSDLSNNISISFN